MAYRLTWLDLIDMYKMGTPLKRDDGNYYITAMNPYNQEVSLISVHANPAIEKPFQMDARKLLLELNSNGKEDVK